MVKAVEDSGDVYGGSIMSESVKESIPICWVEANPELSNKCKWQNKFWRLWSIIDLEHREAFVEDLRRVSNE